MRLRATGIALAVSLALTGCENNKEQATSAPSPDNYNVAEASISTLQSDLESGKITSAQLVQLYLDRIETYDPAVRAVVNLNPKALEIAQQLDKERAEGNIRGPLHGIPVALKDNIHTTDVATTSGSLAFKDYIPPYDATLTTQLKEAGAIIIAKTTLTELANWMSSGMPDGYTALKGYSLNPYDTRLDFREGKDDGRGVMSPGGSSSGIGTTLSLWAASVGTETSGSILIPSNYNMLVGIKPTLGRVSRHGIVPIAAEQDTAGPMARTVADAALMLDALQTTTPDPNDSATGICKAENFSAALEAGSLKGARIGIPRAFYYDPVTPAGGTDAIGGLTPKAKALMKEAIAELEKAGAIIVDPVDIPSVVDPDPTKNFLNFQTCAGAQPKGKDQNCSVVMKYGMKRDFNLWAASLGADAPVKNLTELREFNDAHQSEGAIKYEQQVLDICDEMDVEGDKARFIADRERDLFLTREHGLDAAIDSHQLDAMLFPSWASEGIGAKSGYPSVTVPYGMAENTGGPESSADFEAKLRPHGVTFTGKSCSESKLIGLAYAFEQLTQKRTPPTLK